MPLHGDAGSSLHPDNVRQPSFLDLEVHSRWHQASKPKFHAIWHQILERQVRSFLWFNSNRWLHKYIFRNELVKNPFDKVTFQTDYVLDLAKEAEYGQDLNVAHLFNEWINNKLADITTYRDQPHCSKFSKVQGLERKTPFMQSFDDSLEGFILNWRVTIYNLAKNKSLNRNIETSRQSRIYNGKICSSCSFLPKIYFILGSRNQIHFLGRRFRVFDFAQGTTLVQVRPSWLNEFILQEFFSPKSWNKNDFFRPIWGFE